MLRDAWELAIKTMSLVELKKLSERLALARSSRKLGLTEAGTIKYAYGLVVETVRRKNLIADFIQSITRPRTLGDFPLEVSMFLRLYVCHMRFERASANTDLKEAEHVCSIGRAILGWQSFRKAEQYMGLLLTRPIEFQQRTSNDEENIGLQTFQPVWFVKYCFRLFGRHEAISFLKGSIYPPPVCIRLNTLQASQEEILRELAGERLKLESAEPLRHAFRIRRVDVPLRDLCSFKRGLFFVQDKASCFTVEAANPLPGQIVLDVCSAPGSKTTYLGQLMKNQGRILSLDYSRRRLETLRQEDCRMGVKIVEPVIGDACGSLPIKIEADIAVLDPPCTSTGVFGRQPSAKWRLSPKSIEMMSKIQWQMINSVAERVKTGGSLVYSTCSITLEENELLIERFLRWHPEYQLVDIFPRWGVAGFRGLGKCRRLYPHLHECNGFFLAKLHKT